MLYQVCSSASLKWPWKSIGYHDTVEEKKTREACMAEGLYPQKASGSLSCEVLSWYRILVVRFHGAQQVVLSCTRFVTVTDV